MRRASHRSSLTPSTMPDRALDAHPSRQNVHATCMNLKHIRNEPAGRPHRRTTSAGLEHGRGLPRIRDVDHEPEADQTDQRREQHAAEKAR